MTDIAVDRSLAAELVADLVASGATTTPVIAPFTGEVFYELPASTAHDVQDAAAAARVAQLAWLKLGFAERERILLKAHDLMLADRDLLLDILQTETGKTRGQAFEELFQGASATRYAALTAKSVMKTRSRRGGIPLVFAARVTYRPKGIVGVITPWNYPLSLGLMDIVPALATGNAVIEKVDNQGALTMLAARRAFVRAGVPAALWAIVAGDGNEIGNAVVDTGDYVCFTGSMATGTRVGLRAMGRLINASLELGGKNPMIVLDDVKPKEAAANAVYAVISSMGQLCMSVERIYVEKDVAAEFTTAFVERVRSLTQGAALDYSTDVGSLTNSAQLERVTSHVDDAVAKGATVLAGGRARPDLGPYFYEPTVLTDVTSEMDCYAGETFGPVVAITVVDSVNEAIAEANDSEFGLNASVFSGSKGRARAIAERLTAGSVNINEGYRASMGSIDAPMGGMKRSGIGRRNGREGMVRFLESRTIAETTGIIALPRTGAEWEKLAPTMEIALRVLRALRRR